MYVSNCIDREMGRETRKRERVCVCYSGEIGRELFVCLVS